MFPSLSQNTVGVYNQINFLITCYVSSRLVTLPIAIDATLQVFDIFDLTLSLMLINYDIQILHFYLFLKCLLAARLTLSRSYILYCFGLDPVTTAF
jgi:hypothetical protein